MELYEVVLLGVGLAMDALAVSICQGLTMAKFNWGKALLLALTFGFFQMVMPCIGYFCGYWANDLISSFAPWIAFVLLAAVGINMIRSVRKEDGESLSIMSFKALIVAAIATSIDALSVGITFAFFKLNLLYTVSIIGVITFIICFVGVIIGRLFGNILGNKTGYAGGVILILIGIKILLDHLLSL